MSVRRVSIHAGLHPNERPIAVWHITLQQMPDLGFIVAVRILTKSFRVWQGATGKMGSCFQTGAFVIGKSVVGVILRRQQENGHGVRRETRWPQRPEPANHLPRNREGSTDV